MFCCLFGVDKKKCPKFGDTGYIIMFWFGEANK